MFFTLIFFYFCGYVCIMFDLIFLLVPNSKTPSNYNLFFKFPFYFNYDVFNIFLFVWENNNWDWTLSRMSILNTQLPFPPIQHHTWSSLKMSEVDWTLPHKRTLLLFTSLPPTTLFILHISSSFLPQTSLPPSLSRFLFLSLFSSLLQNSNRREQIFI